MKRFILLGAVLAAFGVANAQTMGSPADAFNAGKEFANAGKGVASGQVNGATGSSVLPNYGTSAPESSIFQGGRNLIGGAGTSKQAQCENYRAPNAFQQQECDAVNFITKNASQRPKFNIDKKTDPLLVGSKGIISNPGSTPGASTQQCRVERVKNPATYITETCTETQTLENLSCKRVLKVACDPDRDGCDQGGIVPNSWTGDMSTSFTPDGAGNYILQFGTIADNYWGGWGAVYDRTLTFDIRDVGLITRFALTYAHFDDWLLVKVNGAVVYVGPHGGDRLEVVSRTYTCGTDEKPRTCSDTSVQYCPTCFSSPELARNWDVWLNTDLKPYLRNGSNTIFMRTVVAGNGEGAIQITTRQMCPRNCRDEWDNSQCSPMEQRAQ